MLDNVSIQEMKDDDETVGNVDGETKKQKQGLPKRLLKHVNMSGSEIHSSAQAVEEARCPVKARPNMDAISLAILRVSGSYSLRKVS